MMSFREVKEEKRDLMPLLLMGDEQESMIERYLDQGRLFALYEGESLCAVCVVTRDEEGQPEIRNIAVDEHLRRRGYGRAMIEYVCKLYQAPRTRLKAATGDSPLTVPFYEKCGFTQAYREKDYFPKHYDHPIVEGGVVLRDRIHLYREL